MTSDHNFWSDNQKATDVSRELEGLKKQISEINLTETRVSELSEMVKLAGTEKDLDFIKTEALEIEEKLSSLEFHSKLGGEYDRNDAILAIHSGAGGVDAQDWSEMLLRMYLRWAERKGFKTKIIDESRGGEAGIKSVTVEIEGAYSYGYLKSEAGVHRLVRLSPFNADHLRQTSFSLVEVLPVIEEIAEVKIDPKDLRIDTYRSSGAGGQSVNKTSSAVRITHVPTNIVVTCQSERSQLQNKERTMKVLKAKLHKKFIDEKEKEKSKLRGEYHSAEWGNQIRSYVIHPYKMVKDHRTKFETVEAEKVLNGEIDGFIEAYLNANSREC